MVRETLWKRGDLIQVLKVGEEFGKPGWREGHIPSMTFIISYSKYRRRLTLKTLRACEEMGLAEWTVTKGMGRRGKRVR